MYLSSNLISLLLSPVSLTTLLLVPLLHLGSSSATLTDQPQKDHNDQQCRLPPPCAPPSESALLKVAWYGSELLGIASSFLRPSPPAMEADEGEDVAGEDLPPPLTSSLALSPRRAIFVPPLTSRLTIMEFLVDLDTDEVFSRMRLDPRISAPTPPSERSVVEDDNGFG